MSSSWPQPLRRRAVTSSTIKVCRDTRLAPHDSATQRAAIGGDRRSREWPVGTLVYSARSWTPKPRACRAIQEPSPLLPCDDTHHHDPEPPTDGQTRVLVSPPFHWPLLDPENDATLARSKKEGPCRSVTASLQIVWVDSSDDLFPTAVMMGSTRKPSACPSFV
jgi:hypothetical protein